MSENLSFPVPQLNKVDFNIDGKKYTVQLSISYFDFLILGRENISLVPDYKRTLAKFLYHKIDSEADTLPDFDSFMALPDDVFQQCIDALLLTSHSLQQNYQQHRLEVDMYAAIIAALNDEKEIIKDNSAKAYERIKNNLINIGSMIVSALSDNRISLFMDNLLQAMTVLGEKLASFSPENLQISKEEQDRLVAAYEKWAEYGWTQAPSGAIRQFDTPPENEYAANLFMRKELTKENIAFLFSSILEQKKVKKDDFEDAIGSFNSKQYKACCLLLFSLIDRLVAKIQPSIDQNNQWRRIGNRMIKRLKDMVEEKEGDGLRLLVIYLQQVNTIKCFEVLYKDYPGFTNEPKIINRNFVVHGMTKRKITKQDCLKVFLLYYNLLVLCEDFPNRR